MNIANLYRKIKQILNDSNIVLVNKGLNSVNSLHEIPNTIANIESINKLTYILSGEIIEVTEDDLNGITTIVNYAFKDCFSLTSVTIPDSVMTIGDEAFYDCSNLTSVIMSNSLTTIGESAFYKCTSLISIAIPGSITSIGGYAFYGCNNLTDIYINSTTPPTLKNRYGFSKTATIHVPRGSGNVYKSATNWSSFESQIIEDIEM